MMKYVRPSDFEDMMRPAIRAAMDQGWQLRWTANGHVKCIPKRGPPVIISVTNAAYKPNISMLRAGGLVLPEDDKPQPEKDPTITKPGMEVEKPEPPPPPKEKRKVLPRGSVQNAVMNFFQSHTAPGITHSLDEVVTHVRGTLPGVTREVVSTTCSQSAAAGKLIRMGKGMYRYARQDRRAEDRELSAEEQQMLEEDEKVLNEAMDALAKLQEWATKMRKMSVQFNRMKKMLEGLKIQ